MKDEISDSEGLVSEEGKCGLPYRTAYGYVSYQLMIV